MRLPWTTMTELGTGAPPLPSISVPPWMTKACGCCASTGPKTPDASTASHETATPPNSNFHDPLQDELFCFAPYGSGRAGSRPACVLYPGCVDPCRSTGKGDGAE